MTRRLLIKITLTMLGVTTRTMRILIIQEVVVLRRRCHRGQRQRAIMMEVACHPRRVHQCGRVHLSSSLSRLCKCFDSARGGRVLWRRCCQQPWLNNLFYFIVYPRVYPICTFYIHFVNILTQDSHQKHTLRLRCQLVIERF